MVENINKAKMKMLTERFGISNNPIKEKKKEKITSSMGKKRLLRK